MISEGVTECLLLHEDGSGSLVVVVLQRFAMYVWNLCGPDRV